MRLRLNWLLMRPTCAPAKLSAALEFARRFDAALQVDLIHYSLPYFCEGNGHRLQFLPEDRPELEALCAALLRAKRAEPERIEQSTTALRAIPDWLLAGPAMRVPCDKYDMLWIGADGVVQLCYVTFPLGNLHQTRLRDLLHGRAHRAAARDAFRLRCPNCHCGYDSRTLKHFPSRRRYGAAP
jgi:cyclic pyranopterin phosphate synthase